MPVSKKLEKVQRVSLRRFKKAVKRALDKTTYRSCMKLLNDKNVEDTEKWSEIDKMVGEVREEIHRRHMAYMESTGLRSEAVTHQLQAFHQLAITDRWFKRATDLSVAWSVLSTALNRGNLP